MLVTFSNPRLLATFEDWPMGGSKRGQCKFIVQRQKKGWRLFKQTRSGGKLNAPKVTTFGGPCCIVDGSNGKTYFLQVQDEYVQIMRSDFMYAEEAELGCRSTVFPNDPHNPTAAEDYQTLHTLIAASYAADMEIEKKQ